MENFKSSFQCNLPKSQAQKRNYQRELDQLLSKFQKDEEEKPSLLLHACCGPCSSYCLEYLTHFFDITVFYYNPNIYPPEEYSRRFNELKKLYQTFPPALEGKVKVVEKEYIPQEFYDAIKIKDEPELAKEAEKGERCRRCYELRISAAYDYAKANSFDYFCTTLSISPFKDAEKINVIGETLAQGGQTPLGVCNESDRGQTPRWLPSDFKKKGGFKRSLEISQEFDMYRQDYCGCVYSKNNTIHH